MIGTAYLFEQKGRPYLLCKELNMCVACLEYIKNKLNEKEFKSALVEMTMDDKRHLDAVNRAMSEHAGNPEKLKKALEALAKD